MSTLVTTPLVTVMSAVAPLPLLVIFVNGTRLYVVVPDSGVYPLPGVMLALSTVAITP